MHGWTVGVTITKWIQSSMMIQRLSRPINHGKLKKLYNICNTMIQMIFCTTVGSTNLELNFCVESWNFPSPFTNPNMRTPIFRNGKTFHPAMKLQMGNDVSDKHNVVSFIFYATGENTENLWLLSIQMSTTYIAQFKTYKHIFKHFTYSSTINLILLRTTLIRKEKI